jgi:hypothetical protein
MANFLQIDFKSARIEPANNFSSGAVVARGTVPAVWGGTV